MKFAKQMLALTLVMLPVLAGAQMTTDQKIVAQVPFEFMVANQHVPAGQCIVLAATPGGRTLMIQNVAAKISFFAAASPDKPGKGAANYAFVFNKYGNRYFLTGIKLAGAATMRLPEAPAEAELRAQNLPSTQKIVLASLK